MACLLDIYTYVEIYELNKRVILPECPTFRDHCKFAKHELTWQLIWKMFPEKFYMKSLSACWKWRSQFLWSVKPQANERNTKKTQRTFAPVRWKILGGNENNLGSGSLFETRVGSFLKTSRVQFITFWPNVCRNARKSDTHFTGKREGF